MYLYFGLMCFGVIIFLNGAQCQAISPMKKRQMKTLSGTTQDG